MVTLRFVSSLRAPLTQCLGIAVALASPAADAAPDDPPAARPNIVLMVADDLGYGELHCFNPERGRIPTPHADALAAAGMRFTDAHSASSVCTPTRYGLLTGRYAWRTRLQSGVLTGGRSLIEAQRLTLARMLDAAGYETACFGKWHLGMLYDGRHNASREVPVGSQVTDGPIDRGGFDQFHGFHHSRQINVWVDDDRVTEWVEPIDVLPKLVRGAVDFIDRREATDPPFFLYIPWNAPHSPVVPSTEWQGRSGLNPHADFVMQLDDAIGQVVDGLRRKDLLDKTVIVCTSDNGTSAPTSQLDLLQQKGHFPSGPLRGSKADLWDGGHRVPLIIRWDGVVAPGSHSDSLVCLNDVLATVAEMLGVVLPSDAAEDSISFLEVLKGEPGDRERVIHHSVAGYFGLRSGPWKLCLCPGSGGWTAPRPTARQWRKQLQAGAPMVQLYDLEIDLAEQDNAAVKAPEQVRVMRQQLLEDVNRGRTTEGPASENAVKIEIEKSPLERADESRPRR